MAKYGFMGVKIPVEYGGAGGDYLSYVIMNEEFSRQDLVLSIYANTSNSLGGGPLLLAGSEEQKKEYLPPVARGEKILVFGLTEPGAGSDAGGTNTTAIPDGDDFIINGRKCFITNNHCADWTIITAKTGTDEKGRTQLSAIFIEKGTPGFQASREENKLGLRGSFTGDLVMTDVKVPAENLVGPEGKGSPIALKQIGESGRASMSAICVGIMRGLLEEGVKFSSERIIYGKPLNKLQAIQFHIAEMRTDYEAARLLTYQAACLRDEGVATTPYNGMAKLFATNAAVRCAQHCIELMGGYGVINEYPVGRFMREALASISSGGTNEVQKMIVFGDTLKNFS
jgi:alkylation response protein AidB-like acyl-CoA dehydrogenase